MSEPARLGEVLLEVMSDITKRMDARFSLQSRQKKLYSMLVRISGIENREMTHSTALRVILSD